MKKKIKKAGKTAIHRLSNFSIGMRTVKTALAVLVCMLLYLGAEHFAIANNFDAFLALVAAVICMQDSVKNSIRIGLSRLAGTVLGVLFGMGVLYVDRAFHHTAIIVALLVIGTIVLIGICNLLAANQSIVIGCVVFYLIALQTTDISPIQSGLQRFLDTAVGVVVAILINRLVRNPDRNEDDNEDDVDTEDEGRRGE